MKDRKIIVLRIGLAVLIVFWMALIFGFSGQNAEASEHLSGGITEKLQRILLPGWNSLPADIYEQRMHVLHIVIRKCAHFTEYFILGCLTAGFAATFGGKTGRKIGPAVLFGIIYAMTDEFHQSFVGGRSMELRDVCIDAAGTLAGVLVLTGLLYLVLRIKRKK